MIKGLIGKKIGMTQIFDENGLAVPVTLIEAGPCYVTQVRSPQNEGYSAVQLGFEEIKPKRLTGGQLGHLKRNELPPLRFLREFRVKDPEVNEGDKLVVNEIFNVGERVDVTGTSKGKGFQGVIKRWGFSGGRATHGSKFHRAPGSIGMSASPARVHRGKKMPGQMGNARVTQQNLEIVEVRADQNLILVKGAIPGPNQGLVLIRKCVKA